MRQLFLILLIAITGINLQGQCSQLKFNKNKEYKYDLINKKIPSVIDTKDIFDCKSIFECTFSFVGELSESQLSYLKNRLVEMALYHIEIDQPLVLTYGTNGDGGLGDCNLDKKTKKYNFIFVSVSNSCIFGKLPEGIKAFNEVTFNYLDSKYGLSWRSDIEIHLRKKGLDKFYKLK